MQPDGAISAKAGKQAFHKSQAETGYNILIAFMNKASSIHRLALFHVFFRRLPVTNTIPRKLNRSAIIPARLCSPVFGPEAPAEAAAADPNAAVVTLAVAAVVPDIVLVVCSVCADSV